MTSLNAEPKIFRLRDSEIVVRQPITISSGLSMTTDLNAGDKYACQTKACCDNYGGQWNSPGTSRFQCNDTGAIDWD